MSLFHHLAIKMNKTIGRWLYLCRCLLTERYIQHLLKHRGITLVDSQSSALSGKQLPPK